MTHSENKRIEAVTTYLILGKLPLVASTIGVPLTTLKAWKQQQWWHDLVAEIQIESDVELDQKLAKRIDKALELVNDRLENGDYLYDPKTGSFIRKPVNVRDGWKVASEMIDRRWLLRKQPKDVTSQEEIGAILKNLATEFADMARKRVNEKIIEGEVLDGSESIETELSEGVRQLPREAGTDQEPVGTKPGPT